MDDSTQLLELKIDKCPIPTLKPDALKDRLLYCVGLYETHGVKLPQFSTIDGTPFSQLTEAQQLEEMINTVNLIRKFISVNIKTEDVIITFADEIEYLRLKSLNPDMSIGIPSIIVDKCDKALRSIENGQKGIVIGVGFRHKKWSSRGWKTLDIAEAKILEADYHQDIAGMSKTLPHDFNFVHSEFVTNTKGDDTDLSVPEGHIERPLRPETIIREASKILKLGGYLIINTGFDPEDPDNRLYPSEYWTKILRKNGFICVQIRTPSESLGSGEAQNKGYLVKYYALKVNDTK